MRVRVLWVVTLCLAAAWPALAQGPGPDWQPVYLDEPGICEGGLICGPSGALIVDTFPTIADVDWAAFPTNPTRPYTPAPGGRFWFVATDGDDAAPGDESAPLRTLDRAVELARSGDVILVRDGEYPIGLNDDSLILDTPGVVLAAEHVGGVTLVPRSEEWAWLSAIVARADDLVIDGFVIRGFSRGYGILFGRLESPQHNLVLRHLRIEDASDGIRSAIPEGAVNPQPVIEGLRLYDVALREIDTVGFNCGEGPCDDVRIDSLSIAMPTSGSGENSYSDGVAIENGDNTVVFSAEISGLGSDGLDFKGTRVAVANVIVHDVARNGIKFWQDGDVINALVYNTGADAAIVFDGGGSYRILNSVIARHAVGESAYAGTIAYDHPDEPGTLAVINSIFYQNAGALWVSGAFALDVQYSLFYGSSNGEELIWALPEAIAVGEGEAPVETLEAAGGGCCLLPFTDPGFAAPDQGDYTLLPGAYGRDRGVSDGVEALPPFDLLGRPRIAGGEIDLGPYEMPVDG